MEGPWAVMGDFNCILNREQRLESPVTLAELKDFRKCVKDMGLKDLKSSGAYFTWNNIQRVEDKVMSRIDRVLINNGWITKLPASKVHYKNEGAFDHCPGIISWEDGNSHGKRQFKYFNMWSLVPKYKEKVKASWDARIQGRKMFQVVGKLNRLKNVFYKLNTERFSEIEKQADKASEELTQCQILIQQDPRNGTLIEQEIKLHKECIKLNTTREAFLRQRSKVQWLKEGDQNTRFYHSVIKARRTHNRIFSNKTADGQSKTDMEGITKAFTDYYRELLRTNNNQRKHANSDIIRRGTVVNEGQRCRLVEKFTEKEIKIVLWEIDGDKAPSPDGYGSQFFKDSWEIVKKDLIAGVQEFFETGRVLKGVNNTVITLIPKGTHADTVLNCMPITCCNTIYKIISMMMCNRLKEVLPGIISENQSAFVSGRTIVASKREFTPVVLMLRGLKTFAEASGLTTNNAKSNIFSANMPTQMVEDLCELTEYLKGKLPFRYLGIPILSKRLAAIECETLVIKWWPELEHGNQGT
ncbi:uncharacterized protein LOC132619488 [Lycium barbarum]|uniref:uncharacterized protein LOC132619488 n=1 Tax=Lycium barbarum TaxID=112863 RepID=UPI00293EAA8E|nr:uncharacterized protein LOC132619488 [Lycium barbarum]